MLLLVNPFFFVLFLYVLELCRHLGKLACLKVQTSQRFPKFEKMSVNRLKSFKSGCWSSWYESTADQTFLPNINIFNKFQTMHWSCNIYLYLSSYWPETLDWYQVRFDTFPDLIRWCYVLQWMHNFTNTAQELYMNISGSVLKHPYLTLVLGYPMSCAF